MACVKPLPPVAQPNTITGRQPDDNRAQKGEWHIFRGKTGRLCDSPTHELPSADTLVMPADTLVTWANDGA
jgi:hypothetical protein